jgi:hypothetical protein
MVMKANSKNAEVRCLILQMGSAFNPFASDSQSIGNRKSRWHNYELPGHIYNSNGGADCDEGEFMHKSSVCLGGADFMRRSKIQAENPRVCRSSPRLKLFASLRAALA